MNKKKPKVSIIVNCHNGEKFLKDAIKSILFQSFKNWEVIFWDNMSDDKSKKIFQAFKDSRLRYFYSKTKTPLYRARNLAIQKARGKFIAFLDTDDIWIKNKLQTQINYFQDGNVGLVYSNFWLLKNKTKKIKLFKNFLTNKNSVNKSMLVDYEIGILTVMIRKKTLLLMNKIFEEKFSHIGDMDLMWRITKICKFKSIQKPLAYYRIHENNLSNINRDKEIAELKVWVNKNKKKLSVDELNATYSKVANKVFLSSKLQSRYFMCLNIVFNSKYFNLDIKNLIILITPNLILKKLVWF